MPRYKGPSRGLKHKVETLLTDLGLEHLDASCASLKVPRSEALRQAVEVQYVTIFSSKSIDATIQPTGTEGTQT
jgi:hypothetical protein